MAAPELDFTIDSKEFASAPEALDFFDDVSSAKPEDVKEKKKEEDKTPAAPVKEAPKPEAKINSILTGDDDTEDDNEENQDEDTSADDEKKKEEENNNIFASLSEELLGMGIFSKDDGEDVNITTPQEFADRWELEKRKGAVETLQSYLQSKGEEKMQWFDAIFDKGISPREYMQMHIEAEDLSKADLTLDSNQEKVVREALKSQGYEPEDVDAEIQKLKNIGELENTATRAHKALIKKQAIKIEQTKQQAIQKEQAAKAERDEYKASLTQIINTKLKAKEFDGIPLTQVEAQEVFDSLYNHKYTLPDGSLITQWDKDIIDLKKNPELKLKMGLILNLLKKDPSLSVVKKKAVSNESNGLFKDLASKKKTLKEAPTNNQKGELTSWFR